MICTPTFFTGFSEVIGSWKIMAIWVPQKCLASLRLRLRVSLPSKNTSEPSGTMALLVKMFMIERTSTDLPEPGLAHDADGLAFVQGEAHSVDRLQDSPGRVEIGAEVLHLQQWALSCHDFPPVVYGLSSMWLTW